MIRSSCDNDGESLEYIPTCYQSNYRGRGNFQNHNIIQQNQRGTNTRGSAYRGRGRGIIADHTDLEFKEEVLNRLENIQIKSGANSEKLDHLTKL